MEFHQTFCLDALEANRTVSDFNKKLKVYSFNKMKPSINLLVLHQKKISAWGMLFQLFGSRRVSSIWFSIYQEKSSLKDFNLRK